MDIINNMLLINDMCLTWYVPFVYRRNDRLQNLPTCTVSWCAFILRISYSVYWSMHLTVSCLSSCQELWRAHQYPYTESGIVVKNAWLINSWLCWPDKNMTHAQYFTHTHTGMALTATTVTILVLLKQATPTASTPYAISVEKRDSQEMYTILYFPNAKSAYLLVIPKFKSKDSVCTRWWDTVCIWKYSSR